jgi:hypothetical protein
MRALYALLLACGCSTQVDLTLTFDESVSDAQLASLRRLAFAVSGAETTTYDARVEQGRIGRTARIIYVPAARTGTLRFSVDAIDPADDLTVIAHGEASADIVADRHAPAEIVMHGGGGPGADAAMPVDFAGADLAGADLAGFDLDEPDAGADLALPGDLAIVRRCPDLDAVLCDDFSGASLSSQWKQPPLVSGGTLTIDTADYNRAAGSLRATHSGASTMPRIAVVVPEMNAAPSPFHIRFFAKASGTAASGHTVLVNVFDGTKNLGLSAFGGPLALVEMEGTNITVLDAPSPALSTSIYECIELEILPLSGKVYVYRDGNPTAVLSAAGLEIGAPRSFMLGVQAPAPSAGTSYTVRYDDLIVDDKAIGCTK